MLWRLEEHLGRSLEPAPAAAAARRSAGQAPADYQD